MSLVIPKPTISAQLRLPLVDALRALAASLIAWHHFVLYGPLSRWAAPNPGELLDILRNYRWAAQFFFVVGGYVLARSMSRRTWDVRQVGWFVVRRYCRLGIPYLAAVALAVAAGAMGQGELSDSVVGHRPTWDQLLAHAFFLQDILGYESLSAGLWFVCIDFQLGLIYLALLYLRDALTRWRGAEPGEGNSTVTMVLGGALAASSLFYFNLHDRYDVWALFFFGQFFLGVMVYHGLKAAKWLPFLGGYVAMMVAALAYDWRWRQVTSLLVGVVLFGGGKSGLLERWPASRLVAYLGRTSYSLFLIHYPVLIGVSSLWVRFGWIDRSSAIAGLIVVYAVSLLAADLFFRAVEVPATLLARKFS